MSSFTERPILTPLFCGKIWVVRKEFSYEIGNLGSGDKIVIPVGFITDLASVPRIFWSIYPPFGRYLSPSILHDFLYWEQCFNRKRSDEIFLEGMKVLKVGKFDRNIIYNAVKLFGGIAWRKNKKDKRRGNKKIIDVFNW